MKEASRKFVSDLGCEEVAALEADEDDRREMIEVAAFMEAMRAEG
jgi:hypothetical protein